MRAIDVPVLTTPPLTYTARHVVTQRLGKDIRTSKNIMIYLLPALVVNRVSVRKFEYALRVVV